jgi:rare lipoprotein A
LPPPAPAVVGASEEGVASWYGNPYHGRRTSNGEIYNMEEMTAAHPRLPFDTWVRVTLLSTGRSVDVRINDRGPFLKDRIIDLSRAAAREIGLLGPGTAAVRVNVIAPPGREPPRELAAGEPGEAKMRPAVSRAEPPVKPEEDETTDPTAGASKREPAEQICGTTPFFAVQIGAFREEANAQRLATRVGDRYGGSLIQRSTDAGDAIYRVLIGKTLSYEEAQKIQRELARDRSPGFVTRVDSAGSCL